MADLVESKPLSGFQDLLPKDALAFERAVEKLKAVFRRYGYAPIDTPCIYRYETLTGGRAGIDKELFEWRKKEGREGEGQGSHIALRFDLTVPLARYVAANAAHLTFPFKRYDIGKVWRGERPQKGRFREFYQCDFDVVGTVAPTADLEVALVIADSLAALGIDRFQIRLNDRQILNGLLGGLGLLDRGAEVLRVIDKVDKIGEEAVLDELARPAEGEKPGLGVGEEAARAVVGFIRLSKEAEGDALLDALADRFKGDEVAARGVERLRMVVKGAQAARPRERFAVDLSIARGLGYYTGTVYETTLLDAPEFGSVSSGGRYDDLASYYTKQWLPGVGASWSHRLAALIGALLVVWLVVWARRFAEQRPDLYRTDLWALAFIILQTLGGGFVVLSRLSLASALLHAALMALLFAALADGARRTLPQRRISAPAPDPMPAGLPAPAA